MAATCMLIESIGEGIKKIDKKMPGFLVKHRPEIEWRQIKAIRDHIAHGYMEIDATPIVESVKNDVSPLLEALKYLKQVIYDEY